MVPLVHRDDLYLLFLTMWIRIFGRGRLEAKIGLLFQKLRGSEMGFLNVVSLPYTLTKSALCGVRTTLTSWREMKPPSPMLYRCLCRGLRRIARHD